MLKNYSWTIPFKIDGKCTFVKAWALLLSLLLISPLSLGQTNNNDYFWELINTTYEETNTIAEHETSLADVREFFAKQCPQTFFIDNEQSQILTEAEYWDKNYGIELRGGLTSGDLDSSDIDANGNTYLELSWDVLSNGMQEFDYRANNLRRQAALERIQNDLEKSNYDFLCRRHHTQSLFIPTFSRLYNAKLLLMEPVLSTETKAYFEGKSYLDELYISHEHVATLRLRLEKLVALSQRGHVHKSVFHPAIVDIDIEAVLDDLANDPRFSQVLALNEQRSQRFNPYRDGNRLRVFIRKEFDILSSDRDDLIAGLRFAIPLNLQDRPTLSNDSSSIQREAELALWERKNRVIDSYNSYVDQLERTVTQHYRYLRAQEKILRVINRQANHGNVNVSAAIVRLLNYVDAVTELVSAKQSLLARFNTVMLASRLPYKPEYLIPMSLTNKSDRVRPFTRGLYIWSNAFNAIDNDNIAQIIENQQFSTLYLSNSKNLAHAKAKAFMDTMRDNNVTVKLITGDNSWFRPDKHTQAAAKVAAVAGITDAVHLDIEPQALDDYHDNKALYQTQFVEMIKVIRESSPDIHLSIAIPFHWRSTTYNALDAYVDEFVLMNYGNVSDQARIRRINHLLEYVTASKVQIALRPQDFDSPYAMEQSLQAINDATMLAHFVFHDLNTLITTLNSQGETK